MKTRRKELGRRWALCAAGVAVVAIVGATFARREPAVTGSTSARPASDAAHVNRAADQSRAIGHRASEFAIVSATAPASFEEMLAALRATLGPAATAEEIFAQLSAIARANAALALDLAHALGRTGAEKHTWVAALAESWTKREPQSAWEWLSRQESHRLRDLATGTLPELIIGTMARGEAGLLLRNLDALVQQGEGPLGVAPVVAVHLAMDALGASDQIDVARRAVETWAAASNNSPIGEAAFVSVAAAMSQTAPEDAGRWLTALPPSAERDIALVEFPAHWAQRAPAAALDWAEQHVPPELRSQAIARALSDWIELSPADAGEWLGGYLSRAPASADTDRLVGAVINLGAAVKNSPATALQWTDLITDPASRRAAEEKIVLRWGRQDRAAAMDHLWKSPSIAPERKQALLLQMQSSDYLAFEE